MASRAIAPTINSRAIDAPLAAFAGLAVAFVVGVMPADLLERLVALTGLGSVVPQAAPPLGVTARIVIGGFGAVLAFAAVFILLRLAESGGRKASKTVVPQPDEPEVPRLRRRDFHPDAPQPRPLLAPRDLGEPVEGKRPIWLEPEQAGEEPSFAGEPSNQAEREPEPEVQPEVNLEVDVEHAVAPAEVPQPEVFVAAESDRCEPVPPVAAAAHTAPDGESLERLIERLEQGLSRRQVQDCHNDPVQASPVVEVPSAPTYAAGAPADDRLQSAIASLQRLATQHHQA